MVQTQIFKKSSVNEIFSINLKLNFITFYDTGMFS